MKKIAVLVALCAATCCSVRADLFWGFGDPGWPDEAPVDGFVDGWAHGPNAVGGNNLDLTPDNTTYPGVGLGRGTLISEAEGWGSTWYGTGGSSDDPDMRYLYINLYQVWGDMKIMLSGAGGLNETNICYNFVASDNPLGDGGLDEHIVNSGGFVYDLKPWQDNLAANSIVHPNVFITFVAEGADGEGFLVDEVKIQSDNPFGAVPEPGTIALVTAGLAGLMMIRRKRQMA